MYRAKDNINFMMKVHDTGKGMKRDFIYYLFNDFFLSGCFSALIRELRRERTLIKKQTVCQKEIIRMHDIISAKKTVLINKHC